MAPPAAGIREVLLALVDEMNAKRHGGNLQQMTLLNAAKEKLIPQYGDSAAEEALLTQWQELFRTGLLAWGYNLNNPDPPFFHITESGRRALANATRDPSNPAGYLRHLSQRATVNPIVRSYLVEGLECYVAGLFKAAAVMVGAAAESVVIELRDAVAERLAQLGKPVSKELRDWRAKTIAAGLNQVFDAGIGSKSNRALREQYEAYWTAFIGQIRFSRNDAGHPSSIDAVTPETVHASLLIFPELAFLAASLRQWAQSDLQ